MSEGLPVLSGQRLVKLWSVPGGQVARRRGRHVRMKHQDRRDPVTVPLHRELRRGTLAGILNDAGLDTEPLRNLL